jgi:F-type H+-transporting ATPase subunit delta
MAELATIARPYAEALAKAAGADLSGVSTELQALAAVAAEPQLRAFADNPKVTATQVFDVMTGVLQQPLSGVAANFLRTVLENGRVTVLGEMATQVKAIANARSGISDAQVESAFALDGAALADLSATLEKRFARKLNLSVSVRPELIGGVRVVVGDEVLDTSVAARLAQMKQTLTA